MYSQIANKIKINLCLVLIKILLYCLHNSVRHCSQLDVNNNTCFPCYSSVYTLYINNYNYQRIIRQIFVTAVKQCTHIHTYIHNWPLQPFSQDYGIVSHITHVVCGNFICEWRDLQFNVDSERQIYEKFLHGRLIYSQSFCQKSAQRKLPKKYFSYFIFDD